MTVSRRDFIGASASSAVLLVFFGEACRGSALGSSADFAPSQWIRVDRDGHVTVVNDKSEMGQGPSAAIPLIVAEELGVPWDAIVVEHAQPGKAFNDMGTSGSDSVSSRWGDLRVAAAAAREMLTTAAAQSWGVPAGECYVDAGVVKHRSTTRQAKFGDLVAAASRLPVPTSPALKPASAYTLVGTRAPRHDTRAVIIGTKQYAIDVRVPGMLHAVIARCPVSGGKLLKWSGDRAKAIPGVKAVVAVSNGIAVAADSTWAALRGREALDVEWDESPGHGIDSAELWRRLERAFDSSAKVAKTRGDIGATFSAAAQRLEAEYRYPFQAHAAIEPLNAIAHVSADGRRCEIWAGTQRPNEVQTESAAVLGIPAEQVTVHVLPLGGAFGRRIARDYVLEAVDVSRALHAPVQVVWSREDDFAHDFFQSAAIVRMGAALDGSGSISGWRHHIADFHLSMFGEFNAKSFNPPEELEPWGGFDTPYDVPALDVRIARQAPPVRTGAWRSVFYPSSVFARECFLDEVAHALRRDPLDLRLALLAAPDVISRPWGSRDNHARMRDVLQLAADRAGWGQKAPNVAEGRVGGVGLACNEYHRATVVATIAEVSVGTDGDVMVHRVVCAMDCGRPVNLSGIEAQIEGGVMWALSTLFGREITFANGRVEQRTFDAFPVLRMDRAPAVEAHVVPSTLPPFGVGEQPVPTVIPAVLNAVFAATAKRIRRVPLG